VDFGDPNRFGISARFLADEGGYPLGNCCLRLCGDEFGAFSEIANLGLCAVALADFLMPPKMKENAVLFAMSPDDICNRLYATLYGAPVEGTIYSQEDWLRNKRHLGIPPIEPFNGWFVAVVVNGNTQKIVGRETGWRGASQTRDVVVPVGYYEDCIDSFIKWVESVSVWKLP